MQVVAWDGYKYQVVDASDVGGGWEAIQGPIHQHGGSTALTFEQFDGTNYHMYFLRHDQNDSLYLELQMPHAWDRTQVKPHIHIIPMATPAVDQDIFLEGEYVWTKKDTLVPMVGAWIPFSVTFTVKADGSTTMMNKIVELFQTAPASAQGDSDVLIFWVRRSGLDPKDTYSTDKTVGGTASANVAVLSIDSHYHRDKDGTRKEYSGA